MTNVPNTDSLTKIAGEGLLLYQMTRKLLPSWSYLLWSINLYSDNKTDRPVCWDWEITIRILDLAAKASKEQDVRYLFNEWYPGCSVCGDCDVPLVLDHDHFNWLIRGFLCILCNNAEARKDSPLICNYRHVNPAFLLGLEVKYTAASKYGAQELASYGGFPRYTAL